MSKPAVNVTVGQIGLLRRVGLRHGYTTRAHGDFAWRALEDPEGKARLAALGQEVGFDPALLVTAEQVHGTMVAVAPLPHEAGIAGAPIGRRIPHTDGIITGEPWPLLVTHADCFPVIVLEPDERAVALVHCGWRGSLEGILPRAVERLVQETGGRRSAMLAGIGPGICASCYEVGEEVVQAAWDADLGSHVSSDASGGGRRFDIGGALVEQLLGCGLAEDHMERVDRCSFEDTELASYRRDRNGVRNATVVVVDPQSPLL
jgi:YfiH family protein